MHLTDLLATLPPELRDYVRELETRATALEMQAAALETQAATLEMQASALQARNQFLEEQFRLAQLKRFAPSSEKFGAQGCLFNEAERDVATLAPDAEEEADKGPKSAGKKRGRKPLPAHLRRQRVEHDLPESEKVCRCCQGALHRMGEEISEQLDIVPATVQVLQHVRFKYACRQCDRHGESSQIITSPMPPQPMPGSIASPATVATVLTAKYADGLPMYRLHEVLLRGEVDVARTTLSQWAIKSGLLFAPLYQAMRQVLLACPVIHGDETTVQVLKEDGRRAQNQSYMWVYRTAIGSEQPIVLFEYRPGRGHEHPERFLSGYEGAVMTDGYAAWRMLKGIKHLGCMAHARRYFDEALKAQKNPSGRAKEALRFIAKLYHIEQLARGKPPDGMTVVDHAYRLRQVLSRPILDNLHAWLVKNKSTVMPQSLIGKAINYALGQWRYLYRYIDDGRFAIDNNLIERDIRPFTTGRKAWLFSNSVDGADASAVIYSLMLTCRACDVEPYAYLRHVLTELPRRQPGDDVTDLLPFNFNKN
jgi:transposase